MQRPMAGGGAQSENQTRIWRMSDKRGREVAVDQANRAEKRMDSNKNRTLPIIGWILSNYF